MLILENSFDRKVNKFIQKYTGNGDFGATREFLLKKVYKDIPELRLLDDPVPVEIAIKWFYNPDGSRRNDDYLASFRQILQTLKEKRPNDLKMLGRAMECEMPQSFVKNLSGYAKFEKNTVPKSASRKEIDTPGGYRVIRMDSFNEMYNSGSREWCIGRDDEWWYEFAEGTGTVYLIFNSDADKSEKELGVQTIHDDDTDEDYEAWEYFDEMGYSDALADEKYGTFGSGKYPYDRYGLSKMVVIAYENGMFEVWSRHNMVEGKDGNYLTKRQLGELLGVDVNATFPYVDFNIKETKHKENMKKINLKESDLRNKIRQFVREAIGDSITEKGFYVCCETNYGTGGVEFWITDDPSEADMASNCSEGWVEGPFETRAEASNFMRDAKSEYMNSESAMDESKLRGAIREGLKGKALGKGGLRQMIREAVAMAIYENEGNKLADKQILDLANAMLPVYPNLRMYLNNGPEDLLVNVKDAMRVGNFDVVTALQRLGTGQGGW